MHSVTPRGVLEDTQVDAQADEEPVLAAIAAASIQGLVATGERAGRRVRRVLSDPAEGIRTAPLCFASRGFSVHASTTVPSHDRAGLERLCRYVNRPPLAYGRLQRLAMIAALTDPDSIRAYLTGVGLPADPPVVSPARPPPQMGQGCGRSREFGQLEFAT